MKHITKSSFVQLQWWHGLVLFSILTLEPSRVKSNDNVTETGSFPQMIMLPGMSAPFQGFLPLGRSRDKVVLSLLPRELVGD